MSKATAALLRQYQSKYELYQAEAAQEAKRLELIKANLEEIERKRDELREKISRIDAQVRSNSITVTDHAVLQYLQRYCGIDVEGIRRSLIPPKHSPLYESMHRLRSATVHYTMPGSGHSVRLRLQLGTVVTVLPPAKAAG